MVLLKWPKCMHDELGVSSCWFRWPREVGRVSKQEAAVLCYTIVVVRQKAKERLFYLSSYVWTWAAWQAFARKKQSVWFRIMWRSTELGVNTDLSPSISEECQSGICLCEVTREVKAVWVCWAWLSAWQVITTREHVECDYSFVSILARILNGMT